MATRADGQAFPLGRDDRHGITFREYAAVAALQGLLAANPKMLVSDAVSRACEAADALVAQLGGEATGTTSSPGQLTVV